MTCACGSTLSQGREGEDGSWCMACGIKTYDVDPRACKDCANSRPWSYSISGRVIYCNVHRGTVTADMQVTFAVAKGTCFTPLTS